MSGVMRETDIRTAKFIKRGKVRDIYEVADSLLIVATDRISAFDVVLPKGIPDKGKILSQISNYWFEKTKDIIENHIISTDVNTYPAELDRYKNILRGRSMLVRKATPMPVECIVRGYISGSGWVDYKNTGKVCGILLPKGLKESEKLPEPLFTPSTKAEEGHDINISFQEMIGIVGEEMATLMRDKAIMIYKRASLIAEEKGIIIADTKMEFGLYQGRLILIDELLTPDSSRFWSRRDYSPGSSQESFDKQIVRDYLLGLDWDRTPPGPELPEEIVEKTRKRYLEILRVITGKGLEP